MAHAHQSQDRSAPLMLVLMLHYRLESRLTLPILAAVPPSSRAKGIAKRGWTHELRCLMPVGKRNDDDRVVFQLVGVRRETQESSETPLRNSEGISLFFFLFFASFHGK